MMGIKFFPWSSCNCDQDLRGVATWLTSVTSKTRRRREFGDLVGLLGSPRWRETCDGGKYEYFPLLIFLPPVIQRREVCQRKVIAKMEMRESSDVGRVFSIVRWRRT